MTEDQLKRGQELTTLISTTKEGINGLKELLKKHETVDNNRKFYADKVYNLSISEHSDGSGRKANLSRYLGNEEILTIIITQLEIQLQDYMDKFKNL